jgi:acetyl esterase/lipase
MSLAMSVTGLLMRGRRRLVQHKFGDANLTRLLSRTYPEPAPVPPPLLKRYEVSTSEVHGRPVLRLTPRHRPSSGHLVYTHGGAYVQALITPHWLMLDRATRGTGVTITVPLYELAPEGNVTGAFTFLRKVYAQAVDEVGAPNVTLAGDSSGGGLALGQALDYRDTGLPRPRQVVLFSPWVDVSMTHPGIASLQRHDPSLRADLLAMAGALWADDLDIHDQRVSPLLADLTGLPPVHVFQGGRDILALDACVLAARLRDAGNTGTFTLVPSGFHVYMGAVWTPEARATLRVVRRLIAG